MWYQWNYNATIDSSYEAFGNCHYGVVASAIGLPSYVTDVVAGDYSFYSNRFLVPPVCIGVYYFLAAIIMLKTTKYIANLLFLEKS